MEQISKWFEFNSLILNFNKTHYMQFITKHNLAVDLQITFKAEIINITNCTNFLGLNLDSTLSWKLHIEKLSSKLNSSCYLIRSLRSIISVKNLRTIYFSSAHSIMMYGLIFWGSSPHWGNIFKLQKIIIRTMMNIDNRVSCRELLKIQNILLLQSQYILSLVLFVVKNINEFNPLHTSQAKPSQSSNWGRRLARSASRRPPVC